MKIQETQEETQAQQPHISTADTNNVLQVVRLSMEEILRDAVRRRAAYQVQCVNFGLNTWTLPCQLTESRMKNLLNDSSVRKVRLELEM